jgi:hypothetical protein
MSDAIEQTINGMKEVTKTGRKYLIFDDSPEQVAKIRELYRKACIQVYNELLQQPNISMSVKYEDTSIPANI